MWSVRTLNRNIGTQYYGRRMACVREGLALPSPDIEANDPLEYIKSPVVAEFLGFRKDSKYDESQLEQALIDHLQQFIMELGRGLHLSIGRNIFLQTQVTFTSILCSITSNSNVTCCLN